MKAAHIAIITTVCAAAGAAYIASRGESIVPVPPAEEFYDPQLKITFRPPPGWKQAEPPSQTHDLFSKQGRRLIAHFEGPNTADSCDLILFISDEMLFDISEQLLRAENDLKKKELEDTFVKVNGSIPAWINQYGLGDPPFVRRVVRIILDRGDKKIMLWFALSAKSMREQENAIRESVLSIRLD